MLFLLESSSLFLLKIKSIFLLSFLFLFLPLFLFLILSSFLFLLPPQFLSYPYFYSFSAHISASNLNLAPKELYERVGMHTQAYTPSHAHVVAYTYLSRKRYRGKREYAAHKGLSPRTKRSNAS